MSKEIKREEEVMETAVAEEVAEVVAEKPYTLRDLCDEDLYTVTEIIAKALPDEAKKVFAQKYAEEKAKAEKDKDKKKKVDMVELVGAMVGFDIIRFILSNIKSIKEEVYALLSDLSGIPAADIKKMPFGTTPKMIKEVFTNARNTDFFKELF